MTPLITILIITYFISCGILITIFFETLTQNKKEIGLLLCSFIPVINTIIIIIIISIFIILFNQEKITQLKKLCHR